MTHVLLSKIYILQYVITKCKQMENLLLNSLLIHLLMIYSSDSVTVQPSARDNYPASDWVPWPESTNKVVITVQCPVHAVKFSPSSSSKAEIGFMQLYGTGTAVGVFCTGAKRRSTQWLHHDLVRRLPELKILSR